MPFTVDLLLNMNHTNTMSLITAGILVTIVTATSLGTVLGYIQPVSAQSVGTSAATDFGSSSSASLTDLFEGTPGSVSSSGKDSASASGSIAVCGSTFVIHGVCTEATR